MEEDSDGEAAAAGEGRQRKRPRHGAGWRELANYAWLAVCEQTAGVYVPQVSCLRRFLCGHDCAWQVWVG